MRLFICLLLCTGIASAQNYPPNHPALWGRSIGSQTSTHGLWSNPATIPIGDRSKPYRSTSGFGVYYNDSQGVVEASERVQEASDELMQTSQQRPLLPGDAQPLIDAFKNLDGKVLTASGGGGVFVPLPSISGWDLMAGVNFGSRTATSFVFDPRDEATLETAFALGAFRSNDLVSRLIASGVSIESYGLTAARTFGDRGPGGSGFSRIGVTVKNQEVTLYNRSIELSEFEEGELTQTHRNVKRFNHPNIDLGIFHRWQNWHVSAVASNLNARNFSAQGAKYKQKPGLSVAAGISGDWGAAQADLDVLTRQPKYGALDDERRLRIGGAIPFGKNFQIRAAYHFVIDGRDSDAAVFGVGYMPWESIRLQSSLIIAGKEELGLALQFSTEF